MPDFIESFQTLLAIASQMRRMREGCRRELHDSSLPDWEIGMINGMFDNVESEFLWIVVRVAVKCFNQASRDPDDSLDRAASSCEISQDVARASQEADWRFSYSDQLVVEVKSLIQRNASDEMNRRRWTVADWRRGIGEWRDLRRFSRDRDLCEAMDEVLSQIADLLQTVKFVYVSE
jgi:hypothetical protein